MTVKIVTDSVADIPPRVVQDLGITVVPLIVRFGNETYRDGVDITAEQFYQRLKQSDALPVTSVPPPAAFVAVYDSLSQETDEILVITLSSRLSGTHAVAKQAIGLMKRKCPVEVVDSRWATMAEGFIVMKAAEAALRGDKLNEITELVRRNIPRADLRATFDTLDYLRRGGRIGRAQAFLGSVLRINPIIGMKDGVVEPLGRDRSRAKAIDRLYEFVASYDEIEELAVCETACPDEAEALVERLGTIYPRYRIYHSKMTPAMGTHTGPGLLLVAVLGDRG